MHLAAVEPSTLTSAIAAAMACVSGAGIGRLLAGLHRRGWYRRAGDGPCAPVPGTSIVLATAGIWSVLAATLPAAGLVDAVVLWLDLVVVTVAVLLSAADVAQRRLPDVGTIPLAALAVAVMLAIGLFGGPSAVVTSRQALAAGLAVPLVLAAITLTAGGIGLGDVKLSCSLAVLLGLRGLDAVLTGAFLVVVLAGAWAVLLLARGRADRHTAIALGPFLTAGTAVALVVGA
ncbi:prepilin peptidase [Mobilicoccus massiliensis]|uniref:prepilin peptidase n=1 Tax=Mobilicoccus massiliensis TaxID=1522310 RepID=UPI0006932F61|nr:A24 family peptidase [Mobilicoccus massiliensis]